MDTQKRKYFSGFDSVRFVAASLVVFCHIEIVRHYRGMYTPVSLHWIYETGKVAVAAFLVMSGFLITYLLLQEKETGIVNVRNFYVRRALRIWPLYYLLVLIIFFALPVSGIGYLPEQSEELSAHFGIKLLFFLLLMPQMLFVAFKPVPGGEQLSTIGTEEIFYFIWPWFVKKDRRIDVAAIWLIAGYTVIKLLTKACSTMPYWEHQQINYIHKIYVLLYYNRIDCILIGALAGFLFYEKNTSFMQVISNRFVVLGTLGLLLVFFFISQRFGPFDYGIYSIFLFVLISAIALNQNAAPAITEFMGKISYGIYLWHFVAIFIAFYLLSLFNSLPSDGINYTLYLYLLSYGLTFILATASYYGYERWFLRLKSKLKG